MQSVEIFIIGFCLGGAVAFIISSIGFFQVYRHVKELRSQIEQVRKGFRANWGRNDPG